MLAQSVNENIGARVTDFFSASGELDKAFLTLLGIMLALFLLFSVFAYFMHKKVTKNDPPDNFNLP